MSDPKKHVSCRIPPEAHAKIVAEVKTSEPGRYGGVSDWIRAAVLEKLGMQDPGDGRKQRESKKAKEVSGGQKVSGGRRRKAKHER